MPVARAAAAPVLAWKPDQRHHLFKELLLSLNKEAPVASFERHRWEPSPEGLSRRDRQSCEYEAYLPDRLGTDVQVGRRCRC